MEAEIQKEPRNGPVQTLGTFQYDDIVTLDFGGNNKITHCRIAAIKHYDHRVRYDIAVPVSDRENIGDTVIYEVEDIFVR
jgi:hypothetical protein